MQSWQHLAAQGFAANLTIDEQRNMFVSLLLMFLKIDSGFTVACDSDLRKHGESVSFKKGAVLVDFGEVCNHLFFPYEGKVFVQNNVKNEEYTGEFKGSFTNVIALISFYSQKPSCEKLVVLEDTSCITLHWSHFKAMYRRHPDFKRICCLFNELNGGPMNQRIRTADGLWKVPTAFPEYPEGIWRTI